MAGATGVDLVVQKLHEYLAIPSVVGFELPFFRYLARDFGGLGRTGVSAPGILHLAGSRSGQVVLAHVDRHGLVSRGGGRFGYAAHVVKAAEYGEEVRASRGFVATACSRLADEPVVAYDPGTGDVLGRGTTAHRCDTDASVEIHAAGLEYVAPDTPAGFELGCVEHGERVIGQLDNVLSAAVAYALAAAGYEGDVVFTAREEAGWSARHFLDYVASSLTPTHELLVFDTSPFPDSQPVDDGVVVLRTRDAGGEFAADLVERLMAEAAAAGIRYLVKDREIEARNRELAAAGGRPAGLGRTELGRIVELSGGTWNGATVQVPTTDYHTNMETTSRRAIDAVLRLIGAATGSR